MKRPVFLSAVIAVLFFACVHQVVIVPGGDGNGGGGSTGDSLVCFEGDILPIFVNSCAYAGCHDDKSKQEGYVLDNWQNITKRGIKPGDPGGSIIYQQIASGEMPPGGNLSADQVNLIGKWILEGAKNTVNCNACDTAVFTYKGAVAGIMSTNCTGCHSSTNASGGIDLSTFSGVSNAAISGRLVGAITLAPGFIAMPPGGSLSDCDIKQIEKWVTAGAPNN